MFNLSSRYKYHFYTSVTDMRKSFDGLLGLVRDYVDRSPPIWRSVCIYQQGPRQIKIVALAGGGFVVYYKGLEKSTFELPKYDIQGGWITID